MQKLKTALKRVIAGIFVLVSFAAMAAAGEMETLRDSQAVPMRLEFTQPPPVPETAPDRALSGPGLGRDSLTRPSSYARTLLDSGDLGLYSSLEKGCVNYLKRIYSSGKTLESERLYERSRPIRAYAFPSGGDPLDFFHYTGAKAMADLFHPEMPDRQQAHRATLADGGYEKAFIYPRKKHFNPWDQLIYVAEDPESSSDYGPLRITFRLNPEARAIVHERFSGLPENVKAELQKKYPRLWEKCSDKEIFYYVAEDSGIDLVEYSQVLRSWFLFLRPNAIEQVDISYPARTPDQSRPAAPH
ncbi:MAG: hypothetical protein HY952_05640 [Elusimicrobia bacterium]|nr:hypothetical protein [Elusimicrobiota bacterium]